MAAKKRGRKKTAGRKAASKKTWARKANSETTPSRKKRTYLSQGDVPSFSLAQAIRVPRAIAEHYAFRPTSPLNVAAALEMQPTSGGFRQLCGAAIAYGLSNGGYNAPQIEIEPLGMRIVRPTQEGDDVKAKQEALLRPRVVGEFLRKYDGAQLPREDIARNVLIEMGVPHDRASKVQEMILDGAEGVGFLKNIKDKRYVDLTGVPAGGIEPESHAIVDQDGEDLEPDLDEEREGSVSDAPPAVTLRTQPDPTARRVFITHGKNRAFIEPIKKLLGFGEMEAVVSVERPSVSQPVPDKVMSEMRRCGSAIIHVDAEKKVIDVDANEDMVVNPNVLIEIGAAMALYGRRFILLVREGVKLPSNLQGLFEVRYDGDSLDGNATIRLLEAINDLKNHSIPDRYSKDHQQRST